MRLSQLICKISQNVLNITYRLLRDTHFFQVHFFLRLIVYEKISDTFDIEFKDPKIIQATRHLQPSILIRLKFQMSSQTNFGRFFFSLETIKVH